MSTDSEWYANRLRTQHEKRWKQLLRVQAPYQWNVKRQQLGRCLDVGCGLGRNLASLQEGSLGVDHNADSVAVARQHGYAAVTVDHFRASPPELGSFDGMLLAHVVEHMTRDEAEALLQEYLPYVRSGGRVLMICPQERGYASDPTHVTWTTGDDLARLCTRVGLRPERPRSFPFPRSVGRWFVYNEFTLLAHKP